MVEQAEDALDAAGVAHVDRVVAAARAQVVDRAGAACTLIVSSARPVVMSTLFVSAYL